MNFAKCFMLTAGLAVLAMAQPALALQPDVAAAIETRDILAIEAMAQSAAEPRDRALAAAVAQALSHQDAEAEVALTAIAQSGDDAANRVAAYWELMLLNLRQGDFAASHRALEGGRRLHTEELPYDFEQTGRLIAALSTVPSMTRDAPGAGRLEVKRNRLKLPVVTITINGRKQKVVVDTGAAFPTVSESLASRLGLRILPGGVSISSSTYNAIPARIGIADQLDFGSVTLRHVVFVVLPDKALTYSGGIYDFDSIIGLSALLPLERFEIRRDGKAEWLSYGDAAASADGGARFILEGVRPFVLARIYEDPQPYRLLIDSGADKTNINLDVATASPQLRAEALKEGTGVAGAGGVRFDHDARFLPRLTLWLGDAHVGLTEVRLLSRDSTVQQGSLGWDALSRGSGFVLDFQTMCLKILPATTPGQ